MSHVSDHRWSVQFLSQRFKSTKGNLLQCYRIAGDEREMRHYSTVDIELGLHFFSLAASAVGTAL